MIPAVLHGLWDFGTISAVVVANKNYLGAGLFVLADVIMVIILLIRRHRIEAAPDAGRHRGWPDEQDVAGCPGPAA